jgi:hypothetical protein
MLRLSLISLILAFSASANAEGFDYDFLSVGYGAVEIDDLGIDGNGFTIGASYAFTNTYFAFVDYDAASLDFGVDATTWAAGFGYHRGLSDNVDLVASLTYENFDIDIPLAGSIDDSGLGLGIGVRYAHSQKLELNAGISYVDYSGGNDTGFQVGALYSINDAFSVGLRGQWTDILSGYTLSGRYYFGK